MVGIWIMLHHYSTPVWIFPYGKQAPKQSEGQQFQKETAPMGCKEISSWLIPW